MTVPLENAWVEYQPVVDETVFTPWAEKGWLAHNGQSPEVAVMDFVRNLVRMMQPQLVIETGVGQGYMTRTIASALRDGKLIAFESDNGWRDMIWNQHFWTDRSAVASIAQHPSPIAAEIAQADLCIFDSEWEYRFDEIRLWHEHAKPGAVAIVHDTSDRDGTIHQTLRELITEDLGMTGVFLNNPRGCFMAVQPMEK